MRNRRPVYWVVLACSVLVLVTAVLLHLTYRPPADFGDAALERALAPVTPAGAGPGAADSGDGPVRSDPALPTPTRQSPERPTPVPDGAYAGDVPVVPADARRPAQAAAEQVPAPVGLEIPSLDVGVDVVPVGVDEEGLMEIPESGQDVGWYRFGPSPGAERGSAVLASHVNTRAQGAGVLARLGELDAGDTVTVTLEDGTVADYAVTDRRTVRKSELDERALFDRTGPAGLALVTCGGPWQRERSSYRDNVVVLAEPVAAPAS